MMMMTELRMSVIKKTAIVDHTLNHSHLATTIDHAHLITIADHAHLITIISIKTRAINQDGKEIRGTAGGMTQIIYQRDMIGRETKNTELKNL